MHLEYLLFQQIKVKVWKRNFNHFRKLTLEYRINGGGGGENNRGGWKWFNITIIGGVGIIGGCLAK